MRFHLAGIGVAVMAVGFIACSDNNQQLPPGPRMQTTAPTSSGVTCSFKTLNQLATHYFSGPEAKVVRTVLSAMQAETAFSPAAQDSGFSVMSHIAANINAGNTDVADASNLTNGLLACMYNAADSAGRAALPLNFPEDFSVATNPAQRGAYAVRGGTADTDSVVFSRPLAAPFSGIGPDSVDAAAPWAAMLHDSNPAPRRILVYGMPGTSSQTFDWRMVPRNAVFSPPAIVSVCLNPDISANATKLLHQQNVGELPFVHALWLDLATCSPTSVALSGSGPLQFALGAAHWGMNLLAPTPLSATGTTIVDGLGGTTGGLHSEFGPERTDTVALAFVVQPSDVQVNSIITPPVQVRATNPTTGATVANVTITMTSVNNNGTPADLLGDTTEVTGYDGIATFANLSEIKTGGYVLVAIGSVGGRAAIFVLQATSARFNVRP